MRTFLGLALAGAAVVGAIEYLHADTTMACVLGGLGFLGFFTWATQG